MQALARDRSRRTRDRASGEDDGRAGVDRDAMALVSAERRTEIAVDDRAVFEPDRPCIAHQRRRRRERPPERTAP